MKNQTLGSIQFNNANAYTIAQGSGGGALILDNAGATAVITVTSGSHTIKRFGDAHQLRRHHKRRGEQLG